MTVPELGHQALSLVGREAPFWASDQWGTEVPVLSLSTKCEEGHTEDSTWDWNPHLKMAS